MSYRISMVDENRVPFYEPLYVTYNYAWFYYKFLDHGGFKWLYGKKGKECVGKLSNTIKELQTPICFGSANKGTLEPQEYWQPTPHNASLPLITLKEWAQKHLEGTFVGE